MNALSQTLKAEMKISVHITGVHKGGYVNAISLSREAALATAHMLVGQWPNVTLSCGRNAFVATRTSKSSNERMSEYDVAWTIVVISSADATIPPSPMKLNDPQDHPAEPVFGYHASPCSCKDGGTMATVGSDCECHTRGRHSHCCVCGGLLPILTLADVSPTLREMVETLQPTTLARTWCTCADGGEFGSYAEDGDCSCGLHKHHYHCHVCKGILQIG